MHLPRKLTADPKVLGDPRLKVMPHPADLHVHQILLNELLTQWHDRLGASGNVFSSGIPAVRWYASRQAVEVTGPFDLLNEPDIERDEPETLSFGYQRLIWMSRKATRPHQIRAYSGRLANASARSWRA